MFNPVEKGNSRVTSLGVSSDIAHRVEHTANNKGSASDSRRNGEEESRPESAKQNVREDLKGVCSGSALD